VPRLGPRSLPQILSRRPTPRAARRGTRTSSPRCAPIRWGWTSPCSPSFRSSNAELLGISVVGVWSHLAFARDRNLHFPLLADFEPKGEVARAYHVYRAEEGTSERALFVIDAEGVLRWSYVSPVGVNPGADGILQALDDIEKENAE
jgi:peroxiredoxin